MFLFLERKMELYLFFYFKGMGFVDLLYLKINKIFIIFDKVLNLLDYKKFCGFYYY